MSVWKLTAPPPFDDRAVYRALSAAFKIGPAREMHRRLAAGLPVRHEGELPADALRAAGIVVERLERRPLPERSPEASAAVLGAIARFAQALERVAPDAPPVFAHPAFAEDIALLEKTIGRALPDQLHAWLVRHDGAQLAIGRWQLEPAQALAETWMMLDEIHGDGTSDDLAEPEPGVRDCWWTREWIPIAGDGAGNHLCIDLDPGRGGAIGQVIEFVHDHGTRPRVAASLAAWLESQARGLAAGTLVIVEDDGGKFDGILERKHLDHATLGVLRIRGEDAGARRSRVERDILSDPAKLTQIVSRLLKRDGRMKLAPDTFEPVHVLPFIHHILAGEGSLAARLDRLVFALPGCPDVVHVDVRASTLLAELEAQLA